MAHNATAVPAERSMPPAMMTTVIPKAPTTTGAEEMSIVCRFRSDRKPPAVWLGRVGHGEKDKHQHQRQQRPELAGQQSPHIGTGVCSSSRGEYFTRGEVRIRQ